MSSVFSRSQSSKISTGAWPPSSMVTRVMVSAQSFMRCLPTGVDPVKLTFRTVRLPMSVRLIRSASPWTSWATPAGMPASESARNSSVVQDGAALLAVGRLPLRPGSVGSGERFLQVGLARERHFADRLGVDGVDDGVAGIGRFPNAIDEELEVGFVSHGVPDRCGLMHP